MVNRTLVIAEIGVNHDGKILKAKKLIKVAARAGADIVKFQIFRTENLVTKEAKKANLIDQMSHCDLRPIYEFRKNYFSAEFIEMIESVSAPCN